MSDLPNEHKQLFKPEGQEITLSDGRTATIYALYVKDGRLYGGVNDGDKDIEVEFVASEAVVRPHEGQTQ